MENTILTRCEDDSCCCLSPRSTSALISVVSLTACLVDVLSADASDGCCEAREHVESLKSLLVTLFQMANMLLLLGSIVESPLLLQIYLWYMLGFIVMGFLMAIADFCFRVNDEGVWSFVTFVPEVVFLFEGLGDVTGVDIVKNTLKKLCELENKDILLTENQYMAEIASYTVTFRCLPLVDSYKKHLEGK